MYGGGPASRRGGEIGWYVRMGVESGEASSGTTAHATTIVSGCTGSILAVASAVRGRPTLVVQQSAALPWEAHLSSPSLQHAICALEVNGAARAHSAQSNEPRAVASASARKRTERPAMPHRLSRRAGYLSNRNPGASVSDRAEAPLAAPRRDVISSTGSRSRWRPTEWR